VELPSTKEAKPLSWYARKMAVSPRTVRRWKTRGVYGVRLEVVRIGGRDFATAEAVKDFLHRTCYGLTDAGRKLRAEMHQNVPPTPHLEKDKEDNFSTLKKGADHFRI
jgi:hypothetical protein